MTDKNSFTEEIKEEIEEGIEEGEDESNEVTPLYQRVNTVFAWLIVTAAFLIGGIFSVANVSTGYGVWFTVGGCVAAFPFWVFLTKSGMNWLNNLDSHVEEDNNTQSVTVGDSTEREVICSACGWKNPVQNNYCHDCGNEISAQS
jgi:hypothetical protein